MPLSLLTSRSPRGLRLPAHMPRLHLHTSKEPLLGHTVGLEVCMQWHNLCYPRPRMRPTKTLEANSGCLGISGLCLNGEKEAYGGHGPLISGNPHSVGVLRPEERQESKSIKAWSPGKEALFLEPQRNTACPRSIHRSDPRAWTKFRTQVQSVIY